MCPQVEPYISRLAEVLRIPTHDEWEGIINSDDARALSQELDSFMLSSGLREIFQDIRTSQNRVRGSGSSAANQSSAHGGPESLNAPEFSKFLNKPSVRLPYRSGTDVFTASRRGIVNGGFKRFEFDRLENLTEEELPLP